VAVVFSQDADADGVANMARDVELLAQAERGVVACRVYGWTEPWVTLGRAQRPEIALIDPDSIPWISRPTGGAAVLHGHDLTVGLAFPIRRSVRDSYRIGSRPLIDALNASGVAAVLAETIGADDGDPRRIDCFAGSSANDIVDPSTRAKVCGCALRRTREAILIQASIPVREPMIVSSTVIRGGVPIRPASLDQGRFLETLQLALETLLLLA
jgi:lipoate-protein ligase A